MRQQTIKRGLYLGAHQLLVAFHEFIAEFDHEGEGHARFLAGDHGLVQVRSLSGEHFVFLVGGNFHFVVHIVHEFFHHLSEGIGTGDLSGACTETGFADSVQALDVGLEGDAIDVAQVLHRWRGLHFLFFVVVPYNCLFIYQVVGAYFKPSNNRRFNGWFVILFALLGGFLYIKNPTGWYTLTAVSFALFLVLILLYYNPTWTTQFIIAFLVCLVPFLVVNGLLTGVATPQPVVWYNQQSFSGWRMATIPVEDLFYNFDLFLGFVVLFNAQTKKKSAAFR